MVRGISQCVNWHLEEISTASRILQSLFKEPSLTSLIERCLLDQVLTFELNELLPFLTVIDDLTLWMQLNVIKQAISKQTEYINLYKLLSSVHHILALTTNTKETIQLAVKLIKKPIKQAEVGEIMCLLEGKREEFKQMILESGLISLLDELLESPNKDTITFYTRALASDSSIQERLK